MAFSVSCNQNSLTPNRACDNPKKWLGGLVVLQQIPQTRNTE